AAQRVGDLEIAAEESTRLGPPADRDEVEDLNEEPGPALAPLAHRLDERAKPRHEPVVTDAEQRAARDVANARRLDDEDAGLSLGEPGVPLENLRRDQAVGGGAPGHHG